MLLLEIGYYILCWWNTFFRSRISYLHIFYLILWESGTNHLFVHHVHRCDHLFLLTDVRLNSLQFPGCSFLHLLKQLHRDIDSDKLILPLPGRRGLSVCRSISYAYQYVEDTMLYWLFNTCRLEIGSRILELKHSIETGFMEHTQEVQKNRQ